MIALYGGPWNGQYANREKLPVGTWFKVIQGRKVAWYRVQPGGYAMWEHAMPFSTWNDWWGAR